MDKEKAVLSLLFLTVLAAGCVQSNGGDETESIGGQSISVQDLRLSPQQIYTEQSAQIWLEAENVGELTAEINPGDNKGDEILTNACSDFIDKERYSIITSRTDDELSLIHI